jgi:superfamily II DNA helicase RecQ
MQAWTQQRKEEKLAIWFGCSSTEQDGRVRILVGTTANGTGINPQNVALVIQLGGAWDLISYAQESGSGGRKGQQSAVVLLLPSQPPPKLEATSAS